MSVRLLRLSCVSRVSLEMGFAKSDRAEVHVTVDLPAGRKVDDK